MTRAPLPRQADDGTLCCEEHGLETHAHCAEVEAMLEQIPGCFLEGEGDAPRDAVGRLRIAYDEACEEADDYRGRLEDMLARTEAELKRCERYTSQNVIREEQNVWLEVNEMLRKALGKDARR